MKKLTEKTKYEMHPDGHAVIYLRRKDTGKFEAVYTCHASCIPVIQAAKSIWAEGVVLCGMEQTA